LPSGASFNLGFITQKLGGILLGSPELLITGVAPLESAGSEDISFLSNPLYASQLERSRAACVIVSPIHQDQAIARGACIVDENPYLYFAKLTQLWRAEHPLHSQLEPLVHASALVHPLAQVDPSARIGPLCVVEAGAKIGPRTWLKSSVNVGHGCTLGADCIVHPGVVIGADGFGFAPSRGEWVKIEQLGNVRIGNFCEIGANTCIDRGALGDTVLEDGVKLDNQIQIAHNVHIGAHTAMAAFVGVSGSTKIGAHCTVAGGAGFVGHIEIADRVHIGAKAVITRSIHKPGHYGGYYPFDEDGVWRKNAAILRKLTEVREFIKSFKAVSGSPKT
jgi:UDP-3-O-[3-hydroxymyristoyl] glucosamine N-acyltransferase